MPPVRRRPAVQRAPGRRPPGGGTGDARPGRARPARWPSAPTPTTSNSGAGPPWPSGRRRGAGSTTWCSPTARRAAGTPTPTWPAGGGPDRTSAGRRPASSTVRDGDRPAPTERLVLPRRRSTASWRTASTSAGRWCGSSAGAAGRGARTRPVAPVPPPPRSPGGRVDHHGLVGRGPGSPLLPETRARPAPARALVAVGGGPTQPRGGAAGFAAARSTRCCATAASSSRPWASAGTPGAVRAERDAERSGFAVRVRRQLAATRFAWPGSPQARRSACIDRPLSATRTL